MCVMEAMGVPPTVHVPAGEKDYIFSRVAECLGSAVPAPAGPERTAEGRKSRATKPVPRAAFREAERLLAGNEVSMREIAQRKRIPKRALPVPCTLAYAREVIGGGG